MNKIIKKIGLLMMTSVFVCCTSPIEVNGHNNTDKDNANKYYWMDNIRPDHPRLFLTKEDIPQIRIAAKSYEKKTFDSMKSRVDPLIGNDIIFQEPLAPTGESRPDLQWGYRASDAAMLWLITQDEKYLDFTKELIKELGAYYQMRVDHNLNIEWYVFSQICALCAYDWIYDELSPAERDMYGKPLYKALNGVAWHGPGLREMRYRENVSDYKSGCYGVAILPWYLGLTFYNEGIDDNWCRKMLESNYDLHEKMINFRKEIIGKTGGAASAVAQYSLGYYPYAEYDFFYTFRSATGISLTEKMDYMLGYLRYMDWIRLPDNKEYGYGDVHHNNCKLPHRDMNAHVNEIANLFGATHPEILPTSKRLLNYFTDRRPMDGIPFLRLLHKIDPLSDAVASSESGDRQKAIYFDTMGQVYMRSGVGDDDTYALFVSGGATSQHKHYDNNNFIIYKNGYRALDSGTRPEPGQHLTHYYCRTIAHNCITIRMPGEQFPKHWGGPASTEIEQPIPNDGGQRELLESKLLDFKETEDYVYLASDATKSYHKNKADLVVREFIWFEPDLFLVFDRVKSTNAEYPKTWLYHLASEPKIKGKEFSESSRGGKSICRTLFPADAKIKKIGGPGKQFWSDGQNWPLPILNPGDYGYNQRHLIPDEEHPEVGQWRIEVMPGKERKEDFFMHLIQVGNDKLKSLPKTETFENDETIGVKFGYLDNNFEITFDKNAPQHFGCNIKITK